VTAVHGHQQPQRPNEMWRVADERLPFGQRFVHKAQLAMLEIAQAAVDQARRAGRRAGAEVVALDKQRPVAVEHRLARDARPIDAAADHDDIEALTRELPEILPQAVAQPFARSTARRQPSTSASQSDARIWGSKRPPARASDASSRSSFQKPTARPARNAAPSAVASAVAARTTG